MKFCAACNSTFGDEHTFCPRDGEVLLESPEAMVGRVLDGKYEIEGFIAQGGMGAVYRARHILLGDRVVIKTLRPEMRSNAEWLKRFRREGQAARAFRHPNSVTVYDLSAGTDGLVYLVMEYVEGHTLDRELKRRGRFTPSEALSLLEPVADVLDAAHARGVVHRDLKPENVMLGRDDKGGAAVKVLDLGIAKMVSAGDAPLGGETSLTVAGQILGTPYYMSPEQWGELPRDGGTEIDGRADIYSLGIILFELIAGRKPLGGTTVPELRRKHVSGPRPALQEAVPGVPEPFADAVARAMAKDRGERPQTAGELIEELRGALGLPRRSARGPAYEQDGPPQANAGANANASSEAATSRMQTHTEAQDYGRAETLLTNDFGPASSAATADSAVQATRPPEVPGVQTRREGARGTVAADEKLTKAAVPEAPSASPSSSAHAHEAARPPAAVADPTKAGRSRTLFVAGGVVLLLFAAAGGWLAWERSRAKTEPSGVTVAPTNTSGEAKTTAAATPKVEALGYWLEVFARNEDEKGARVADTSAALDSGQYFRFHFESRERGYLYIVGPGDESNAFITILTAQGVGKKQKSNLLVNDADNVFPKSAKLQLKGGAGTEDYTVIFSPTPLTSPSFLIGKSMQDLLHEEVVEFEKFRTQHRSEPPVLEVKGEGASRRVAVSVSEEASRNGQPVVFEVRIKKE